MAPIPVYSNDNSPSHSSIDLARGTEIPLGEYFFRRVKSLGISSCFTVPGDFNLFFLDHSYNVPGMNLRNCCNELNTAYAADGYARASNKLGVAITTYGVGELSAINGISGSMAEFVPVLHVVGTTPLKIKSAQDNHTHHLFPPKNILQQSNHYVYEQIAQNVSCCVESIEDLDRAPQQIDNVLKQILINKRPGYLYVPCDLANKMVNASRLMDIPGESFYTIEINNTEQVNSVANLILEKIYNSSQPAIVGDVFIDRFQLTSTLRKFVELTQFHNYCTPMAKSVLNESEPSFVGDYWGKESKQLVQDLINESDLVLHFGEYYNEINSGHRTAYSEIDKENIISVSASYVKIGSTVYENMNIVAVMTSLLNNLDVNKIPKIEAISAKTKAEIHEIREVPSGCDITQTYLANSLQELLQPGDYFVCETGSFMFGVPEVQFPEGVKYFGQQFYLSIGYAVPATLGVGCALLDEGKANRLILFEGDGAAQMTAQEFANYLHQGIKPTIILMNNNGYTVERVINGPELSYNDITNWDWTKIFSTFGDVGNKRSRSIKVETKADLKRFVVENQGPNDKIQMVEVTLDTFDTPWRLDYMTGTKHLK